MGIWCKSSQTETNCFADIFHTISTNHNITKVGQCKSVWLSSRVASTVKLTGQHRERYWIWHKIKAFLQRRGVISTDSQRAKRIEQTFLWPLPLLVLPGFPLSSCYIFMVQADHKRLIFGVNLGIDLKILKYYAFLFGYFASCPSLVLWSVLIPCFYCMANFLDS